MSAEGVPETIPPPQDQPAPGKQPSGRRELFWDLKASHWVEVFLTVVLIGVGWLQYSVYTRQANIMAADQRPWISLDMQPEGPLARDVNGWNFNVTYTLNNVGRSPAFNVSFVAGIMPLGTRQPDPPPTNGFSYGIPTREIDAEVERVCDASTAFPDSGEIMFSNVPQTKRWKPHGSLKDDAGYIPGFVIVGCATYKFVDDQRPHRTIRIFELTQSAYGKMI